MKDPEHDPNWLRELVQEMREDGFTIEELADILKVSVEEIKVIGDDHRQRSDTDI